MGKNLREAHPMKNTTTLGLALLILGGCSGGGGGGSSVGTIGGSGDGSDNGGGTSDPGTVGRLTILATDAPLDPSMVEQAIISVDKIRIHGETDGDGGDGAADGFITVYEGDPMEIELTDLTNGLTQLLVDAEVPAGTYGQIRLHVADGSITLTNGNEYTTDAGNLQISSQATSGLKVFIEPPVIVEDGFPANVLMDFDLAKTFKPIPANDPMNADRFKLHPVIRGVNMGNAGEIRGVVTGNDGTGQQVPVAGADVFVLLPDEPDRANSVASTMTSTDGSYAVLGLLEGTYDVLAREGEREGRENAVSVMLDSTTLVDVTIVGTTGVIRGVVSGDDGTGPSSPIAEAQVFILPPGETDVAGAVAETTSDEMGAFAVPELEPGSYDVLARKDTLEGRTDGVVVLVDEATQVLITIAASTGEVFGKVVADDGTGTGTEVGVLGAAVFALPPGETDVANAVAQTISLVGGTYVFPDLPQGIYDVLARQDLLEGRVNGVVVVADQSLQVDVLIQ
jgi:hypothetical protein